VRPWHVIREGDVWFTRAKDADTIYAFLPNGGEWKRGERREFVLKSVSATRQTTLEILGHNGRVVEYKPDADPEQRFEQTENGLRISVIRAQRLYNNSQWPNPVVAKITHVGQSTISPQTGQ